MDMISVETLYAAFLKYRKVVTDSRKVVPGSIFFALKGEAFDGNKFALKALEEGCALAVVDDPALFGHERCLPCADVLKTLQGLASFHRERLGIPVLGITGTNGKTTTKELVISVLSRKYRVVGTSGNLNNHIGVPLTLLSVGPDAELAVVEMGANHPGEIAFLCALARPTHGLITNIGRAHLEGFGGFEGVIRTKRELYDFLDASSGMVLVNHCDALLNNLLQGFRGAIRMYDPRGGFPDDVQAPKGEDRSRVLCSGAVAGTHPGLEVSLRVGDTECRVVTRLVGAYNLDNILAAVCAGTLWEVPLVEMVRALEAYEPGNQRSQWCHTGKNQLLADYYNANPSSMRAALENFVSLNPPSGVVILGDMFELGEDAEMEHREILRFLSGYPGLEVYLAGSCFEQIGKDYPAFRVFGSTNPLRDYLAAHPLHGRTILLKGSRGMRLEQLVPLL